jgi:CBS domain-containing protein
MTIADVMTRELPLVQPADNLRQTAGKMKEAGVKALPVLDGERLVGIITDWDLATAMAEERDPSELTASRYMSTDLVCVPPDTNFIEAAERMGERRIHHLLVAEEGRFLGMVHLDVEWSELGGLEAPIATFTAPI